MKNEEYIPVLAKSRLFAGIKKEQINEILDALHAKTREYKNGEFIVQSGDKMKYLYLVLSGHAVIFKEDYWGNQSIISKAEPSQSFGVSYALSSDSISEVNVCAEGRTKVMLLDVKKLTENGQLARNLITILSDRNIYLSGKIEHISQRRLRDKILSYLSDVSRKKNTNSFEIPFSRKQLADYLNADRSALSNELCKLRDEGIIRFEKNHFELL